MNGCDILFNLCMFASQIFKDPVLFALRIYITDVENIFNSKAVK